MRQRAIYYFDCCTNGRSLNGRKDPRGNLISPHFFLIVSNTEYNKTSKDCITAIPITSKNNNLTEYWNIAELNEDDLERQTNINNKFNFSLKGSYVLCDRPCRIEKKDINRKDEIVAIISFDRYKSIIEQIATFMKSS